MKPAGLFIILLCCGLSLSCSKNRDNSEPPAELTNIGKAINLDLVWSRDTRAPGNTGGYRLSPLLIDDLVYSIDSSGKVRRYRASDGKKQWTFDSGLAVITGLGGDSSMVVIASREGDVAAYQPQAKGLTQLWTKKIESEIRATPVVDNGQVFIRSIDGKLSSFAAADGKVLWQVSGRVPALSLTGNSEPLVTDALVVSGYDDGKLIAYNRLNGQIVWETIVSRPSGRTEIERLVDVDGRFVFSNGIIYVASYQGQLAAVQAVSGDVLWTRDFSSYQAIAIDDNSIYLSADNSHIWSIDRRTGSALWKQDVLHARRITAPTLTKDKLVVADFAGYLHWFNKSDGRLLGRIRVTEARNYVQPQHWQNKVVALDRQGILSLVGE